MSIHSSANSSEGIPVTSETPPVADGGDNRPSSEWGEEALDGEEVAGVDAAADNPDHPENPASPASPVSASSIQAPKPPVTGDRAVDEAMELVSDAAGADLDFQLEAYESAHQTLQDRLADVES
jgi:hypothetical protein